VNPQTEILIKGGLSLLALLVVVWRHRWARGLKPEQAGQLLILTALAAAVAYPNFGLLHGRSGIHHWEQFHYFLGSKYFPELRYDGIYAASLEAERELDLPHALQSHVRDLRSNEVVPSAGVAEHGRQVKARFTADRWRAFVNDTRYFLSSSDYAYITKIRKDHGYNPTPTWSFSARLFSHWIPASAATLSALAWLDPILLTVLLVIVFRSFGSRIGCLALIIFGLGYPWRFDWVGGAFLRQDWLVAIGVAVCLIHRKRCAAAGALIAYATMVRVFPGAFLIGPAVVAVRHHLEGRSTRWFTKLVAGFGLGLIACLLAGCLIGAGPAAWTQFADNLAKHHGAWLTNNVGLKNVLLYDLDTMRRDDVNWSWSEPWILWQEKMNRLEARRRPLLLTASLVFGVMVAAAAWQSRRSESAVLGVAVAFAAVVLTCYYWVMLALIPLGRGRWMPSAGWLGINIGLYGLHLLTPAFEMRYGIMSWALLAFFIAWLGPDAWRTASTFVRTARDGARHRAPRS
jgi:hypothetical protein